MKIKDCHFADDVLYHVDSDTWVRIAGEVASIGVNTIVAWAYGAFSTISFKAVATIVAPGASLGSIEGPRHFDVVRSPLSGTLLETNERLLKNPGLLNKEPYGAGWFAKLRASRLGAEATSLKPIESVADLLAARVTEMRVRCFKEFPDHEMYEIGTECSAVLAKLDDLIEPEPPGTVVHLVSDDPIAGIEMTRWSERTGNSLVEERTEGNLQHFIVKKS